MNPELRVKAHQFLYYVKGNPQITDREYDHVCKSLGIFGGGGSDCASDYSDEEKALARHIITIFGKSN